MAYNKSELLQLPIEERKALVSALEDSILAEETSINDDWKLKLIKTRIMADIQQPNAGVDWSILRKKYFN
jgi:hypothetical protein